MLFLRRFITSSSPRLALKTRHLASSRSFSSREINHKPRSPPTAQDGEDVTVRGAMLNGALATSKAVVGVAAHSPALISDAAHSFSDIATDVVTLLSYRKARQPADFEHPWGHGKYESVGTAIVGCVLIATGLGVGSHAGAMLYDVLMHDYWSQHATAMILPELADPFLSPVAAMGVAAASVALKLDMYWMTLRVGQEQNSNVVIANAYHHRSDALSSAVAFAGIGAASFLGLPLLDPLAGLAVAAWVINDGVDVTQGAVKDLLDKQIDSALLTEMAHVCSSVPGVKLKGDRSIRGRRMGPMMSVDVNITVDGWMSASSAHQLGEHVRMKLMARWSSLRDVRIHIDPDIRQEFGVHAPGGVNELRDPPQLYEERIRAILGKVSEVLKIRQLSLTYNIHGDVDLRMSVLLKPGLSIVASNSVAEEVKRLLVCHIGELKNIELDQDFGEQRQYLEEEDQDQDEKKYV
ncbi:hypothetical protein TrVE_jg11963 [Triparma verrucosa]|uniref:Cation efflux protein cytoplasmic domain-containing protein n=1 Tax=Triparma verrucosa TaxID=1606542 RepID=A0A9W7F5U7_9STRA|nr:hypothetical protein TrVE_jg11963 [Triparma verrucosa]